jgi:tol-pal system protein YbgF
MYIKKTNFVFLGLMAVALSTCATRKDILKVQEELYYLRNQIQTIKQTTENNQKNLAELPAEIAAQNTSILSELDSLDQAIAALQDATNSMRADLGMKLSGIRQDSGLLATKLEDNNYRTGKLISKVESLSDKVAEFSDKLDRQSDSSTEAANSPTPSEIFNNAYRDMSKGNFEMAAQGFQAFLEMFPANEMADYCQYYLAEIAYQKADYKLAADRYNRLLAGFPRSQKITHALYKLGLCYLQLNDPEKARAHFNQVIQQHPNTEEALLARTKLQKLDQP